MQCRSDLFTILGNLLFFMKNKKSQFEIIVTNASINFNVVVR